jgi:hypothetical protein
MRDISIHKISVGNLRERDFLENVDVDGSIIVNFMSN